MDITSSKVAAAIKAGAIGVMPTDTIYGIVASALHKAAVEELYRLRARDAKKPFIILIASQADLKRFGVRLGAYERAFLKEAWPGPVSVILPVRSKQLAYLHRGTFSLAFRLPRDPALVAFLRRTGPLVAPSANLEGKPPAKTIAAAKKYFKDTVAFYGDGGYLAGKASTLISLISGEPIVLRK